MGRRRWRFITIAAFLLFLKDTHCQGGNDYYYTPVERSFAQVQPPLYSNNRPISYFEHGDSLNIGPRTQLPSLSPYENPVRLSGPNFNHNPVPFQISSSRNQPENPFYINQPEFGVSQRPKLKSSLPLNYQFVHSTKKPELTQIHSAIYQNDPSRPETFLGQITLNNPDIEFFQQNRFKNVHFDGNSLKPNAQSVQNTADEDIDNQDLFNHHKVTTYNPSRLPKSQSQLNLKPSGSRFSHFSTANNKKNNTTENVEPQNNRVNSPLTALNSNRYSSTEYKSLLNKDPLLKDDISEVTFTELMKDKQNSNTVQIIRPNNSIDNEFKGDSKPDASSMDIDNASHRVMLTSKINNTTQKIIGEISSNKTHKLHDNNQNYDSEDTEYVEYYDESETSEDKQTTQKTYLTEHVTDIYDEYDVTEEPESETYVSEKNVTQGLDITTVNPNKTLVEDHNFKHFIDTPIIDQIEKSPTYEHSEPNKTGHISQDDLSLKNSLSILGEEVVSVVTTKSVVNGTISIPHRIFSSTEKIVPSTEKTVALLDKLKPTSALNNESLVTTENWVVVASVQTSRSVSGARFLPFPTVEQDEKKQVLAEEDDVPVSDVTNNPKFEMKNSNNNSSSTENIHDKLDSIQSELSSDVLSRALDKENKNIELITESSSKDIGTVPTISSLNVFTLRSTQSITLTERSSPEPLPVNIKKFGSRASTSTTPKPKRQPSLVTVVDNLDGFLPAGYRVPAYKQKRIGTNSKTITSTVTTSMPSSSTEDLNINGTQGRSSGISSKNKVILLDDKSLLPKEYVPKEPKPPTDLLKKIKTDDVSKFLPPGYKSPSNNDDGPVDIESNVTKEVKSHKNLFENAKVDDLNKFLPPDYKPVQVENEKHKNTKHNAHEDIFKKIKTDDISKFLPPGYKSPESSEEINPKDSLKTKTQENLLKTVKTDDISKFLPPGYKVPTDNEESNRKETSIVKAHDDVLKIIKTDDLSKFLPPGYKAPADNEETNKKDPLKPKVFDKANKHDFRPFAPKRFNETNKVANKSASNSKPHMESVDITAFLPPGFKLNKTDSKDNEDSLSFKVVDVSDLLPTGFQHNTTTDSIPVITTTTKEPGGIKIVFPSRPGGKTIRKSTSKTNVGAGPSPVTPKIQKGWPTRAATEFTGWPSPSTTPFSIEKFLEAQRNATATSPTPEWNIESTTRFTTTTTTTTTTAAPLPSTTPGICQQECEIAATIKIIDGVKWVPELQYTNTEEWQKLAKDVKDELNSVYTKSDLKKWYKNIRIDGFSKGSVLVDYFIELSDVETKINTIQLKKMFHQTLTEAKTNSESKELGSEKDGFNPDAMLGDQPEEDKMKKSNERMTKTLDKSVGKLEIGKFVMDPAYTEFIVVEKRKEVPIEEPEEESFLPQWGIAVIVIAMASLLFVVIFGVTVLVNRQKSTKAKQPIPLSEDMIRELDKSHMGGYDDMHQMKERELPYLPTGKRHSTAFIEQLAYQNPGDSWRSEWTPQLQKYMQHYATDSGRGTQIYGPAGNAYGYSGSQLYGQTGGGSQLYGYAGDYPRSHHSRRRSEYDSNF